MSEESAPIAASSLRSIDAPNASSSHADPATIGRTRSVGGSNHMDGNDSTDQSRVGNLAALRALSRQFPTVDSALAEIARLSAEMTLPRETVHVVSDVHGEYVKLRHVINNASGTLRPLVEGLLGDRLSAQEMQEIPHPHLLPARDCSRSAESSTRTPEVSRSLLPQGVAASARDRPHAGAPPQLRRARARATGGVRGAASASSCTNGRRAGDEYLDAVVDSLVRNDRVIHAMRLAGAGAAQPRHRRDHRRRRLLRPRAARRPRRRLSGAAAQRLLHLGQPRRGLDRRLPRSGSAHRPRAARLAALSPSLAARGRLRHHAAAARSTWRAPSTATTPPSASSRAARACARPIAMARMQKAAAILQFKLEGQTDSPQSRDGARASLPAAPHRRQGGHHRDRRHVRTRCATRRFPTIDPSDPYALSAEERACMDRLRQSFLGSEQLWRAHALPRRARLDVPDARRPPHLPRLRAGRRRGRAPRLSDRRRAAPRPGAVRRARPRRAARARASRRRRISTCSGICGRARSRRSSARIESRRSSAIWSPTRRSTSRPRTPTSGSSTRHRSASVF